VNLSEPLPPPAPGVQRRILRRLFLTIALRGQGRGRAQPKKRPPFASLGLAVLLYALVGCVAFTMQKLEFVAFAACLHSMTFLLAGLHLATMSGQVLFSPQEAEVLLHRPVAPRELLAAKVQTIVIVAMGMALSLNVAGFYIGIGRSGSWLFVPIHLLAVTLEIVFCASLVTLAYNLCLRWFGRERLDNLMTTVQMLVAVGIVVGGQIVPRVMRTMDFSALAHPPLWLGALPPFWFASLETVLLQHDGGPAFLAFAALGIGATLLAAWIGVSRLAGSYALGLVALNEASSLAAPRGGRARWTRILLSFPPVNWWLRDPVERTAFRLALAQLGRARGVKLRVYPQAAQFLIYPLIFFFGGASSASLNAFSLAFAGAFVAMLPATIIEQLRMAEDWQAADLFYYAPIERASGLFQGTRKAVIAGLVAPGLVTVAVIGLVWLRNPLLLLVLLPGLIALPLFSQLAGLGKLFIPFSQPAERPNVGGRGCIMMAVSLVFAMSIAGLAGWSWIAGRFLLLLAIEVPVVLGLTWMMRKAMDRAPLRGER
jgi:ABC-2 type transport system permease protein